MGGRGFRSGRTDIDGVISVCTYTAGGGRGDVDPADISEVIAREGTLVWVDDLALTHFQDVYDHVLRATDQIDAQRELMGNAVEAHLAIISNRMNEVMKTMTSWGALLLGSTLIAGIYGMNFEHMPELGWALGYPFAIALMMVATVSGYLAFKRRDWL